MNKKGQELKYVMELLKITGQQLANMINVDRTLVSKWKNGSRPFDISIQYFSKIVEAIIIINEKQNIQTLERFFNEIIPNMNTSNKNWLNHSLSRWLSGAIEYNVPVTIRSNSKALYSANIDIYRGNSGIRKAIISFFNYALSLPSGQQLLFSDMYDTTWLIEDKGFLIKWQNMLIKILEKGHHISIIHNTGRELESITNMVFEYLPIYFSGNITSYYYQKIDSNVSSPSIIVIKGQLALMSMNSTSNNNDRYTSIYKDPFSISQMENIFSRRLTVSPKLVDLYNTDNKNIIRLTKSIIKLSKKNDSSYTLTQIPLFTTMTKETLIDVLKENSINSNRIEQILHTHDTINSFFTNCINKYHIRHLYNIFSLKKYAALEEIPSLELSTYALEPVTISRKYALLHIKNVIAMLIENENFEVSLFPLEKLKMPKKTTISVKQNCFIYSYSHYPNKPHILSSESMVTNGFFYKLKKTWDNIPVINKDKKWVITQLQNLIE